MEATHDHTDDPADPVELEFLALTLDRARARSPLPGIRWLDGWSRGLISGEAVLAAAQEFDED